MTSVSTHARTQLGPGAIQRSVRADRPPPPASPSAHGLPSHLWGEWSLFTDWCHAADRSCLPATADTVLAFSAALPASLDVTRRRARAIRTAHATAGLLVPVPEHPLSPPRTVGERLAGHDALTAAQALRGLPVFHYPAAVSARRDAVLVLMCLVLGWSRSKARRAAAEVWPLPRLDNVDLPLGADPRTCPSCVLTRWLRVLAADSGGGRQLVETVVSTSDRHDHDCRDEVADGWQRQPLLPPVDRHGWIVRDCTLTPRSLSDRLHRAVLKPPDQTADPAASQGPAALVTGRRDHVALAELDALLNRLEAALDDIPLGAQSIPGRKT